MSSLCSLSTRSNSTSCLWGIIMFSSCIIQLYLPFLKTQPSSGLTFNSLSGFPSAVVSCPRCWKPASCSAGFQDLNENFWHSIHVAHCGSLLLWPRVSLWSAQWCFLVSTLSWCWGFVTPFPMTFALPCMYHPSAFQNVGWKQYLGLLLILGREKLLLWLLLLSAETELHSLVAFLCRPCLCKKSNFLVISAIKIT